MPFKPIFKRIPWLPKHSHKYLIFSRTAQQYALFLATCNAIRRMLFENMSLIIFFFIVSNLKKYFLFTVWEVGTEKYFPQVVEVEGRF